MFKKLSSLFTKALLTVLFCAFIVSCQNDFLDIGSGLVNNVDFDTKSTLVPIKAYNRSFIDQNGVQTSGFSNGAVGVFNDPLYGQTLASTLTQIAPTSLPAKFGVNPKVEKVILTMPYYSTATGRTDEGGTKYKLDSVYGKDPMILTIYRSNYFLSENDPNDVSKSAVYYSDDLAKFNGIEGDILFKEDKFFPSNLEIVTREKPDSTSTDTVTKITRTPPAFIKELNAEFWQQQILDRQGSDMLFNLNNFKNFFRGIYLKAEPASGKGSYFLFNRTAAQIELFYNYAVSATDSTRRKSSYVFSLSPNGGQIGVVGYQNDFRPEIVSALSERDTVMGDANLYLKGGQGSMAVIELFGPDTNGDGIPDKLAAMRKDGTKIIRDASLVFHVNKQMIDQLGGESAAPMRLYIYDLTTNRPLADWSLDYRLEQNGAITVVNNKHLGVLENAASDDPTYRIRITEHIKRLLNPNNDDPHTKLGIVVTQNPIDVATGAIEDVTSNATPSRVPRASIISQTGTILYGSNESIPANKRLSLELFYTETSN